MQSKQFSLNQADWNKWFHNLAVFLIPAVLLYTTQVIGIVQNGHGFGLTDLLPTQITWGGIILYVFNGISDILRKFVGN